MTLFWTAVVAGLAIGSIYGLVGIGYTVVFNATRVFNLAQGDLVMLGVMGSYLAFVVWKLPWVVGMLAVLAGVAVVSGIEEKFVVRPFLKKSGAASFGWFIATLGFSAVIEAVVAVLFGHRAIVAIPTPLSLHGWHIGSVLLGYRQVLIIGTFIVAIIGLELFYAKSWLGQAMRGTAEDREAASLRGINPISVSRTAFIMAGLLGAIAGFVIAPITFSDPTIGLNFTLKGFLALAIGGFGSIRGAVVGGITLGIAEQLFDAYVSSNYEILVGLILVVVILSIRPEGLFRSTVARTV
jgi:branched-subunit amino acid ABC-type transport system permease component